MQVENDVFVLTPDDREIPAEIRRVRKHRLRLSGFKAVEALIEFPTITELDVFIWPTCQEKKLKACVSRFEELARTDGRTRRCT